MATVKDRLTAFKDTLGAKLNELFSLIIKTNKTVTGTTYTLLASDVNKILLFTNNSGCTLNVPTGITVGLRFEGKQLGAEPVVVNEVGTTVHVRNGEEKRTGGINSVFALDCRATNTFSLYGGLEQTNDPPSGLRLIPTIYYTTNNCYVVPDAEVSRFVFVGTGPQTVCLLAENEDAGKEIIFTNLGDVNLNVAVSSTKFYTNVDTASTQVTSFISGGWVRAQILEDPKNPLTPFFLIVEQGRVSIAGGITES